MNNFEHIKSLDTQKLAQYLHIIAECGRVYRKPTTIADWFYFLSTNIDEFPFDKKSIRNSL